MRRALLAVGGLLASTGPALAHGGHGAEQPHATGPALPFVLVVAGGAVLATSAYLEHVGALEAKYANAGVLLGVVGFVAGVALGLQAGF